MGVKSEVWPAGIMENGTERIEISDKRCMKCGEFYIDFPDKEHGCSNGGPAVSWSFMRMKSGQGTNGGSEDMSLPVADTGQAKNMTATAAVTAGPCQMLGFYVNSTSSGTVVLRDGGAGGTVLTGTITPAIGFHRFPANFGTSAHATIGGTLDVTFFFAASN